MAAPWRRPAPPTISLADLARLQTHLRLRLGCDGLHLKPKGTVVRVQIGAHTLGTLSPLSADQVDDAGERSGAWLLSIVVLQDDLRDV